MANLFKLTQDVRGNWRRQNLGNKPTEQGDLTKATFTLGKDFKAACERVVLLEKMWATIEADWQNDKGTPAPMWDAESYPIALAVARGETPIYLDVPESERETASRYPDPENILAVWIGSLRETFPFLDLRIRGEADRLAAEQGAEGTAAELDAQADNLRDTARRMRGTAGSETLHQALDAYTAHLKDKYGVKGAGRTQRNQVAMIRGQLDNCPLSALNSDKIDSTLFYFAARPVSRKTDKVFARTTIRNILITFRAFLGWLDRSPDFRWETPKKYRFPRVKIDKIASERVKKRMYFKRSELKLIWRYAMAWDRALILLGLNCGFSKREIATLQAGEIHVRKGHTFISRERVKTDVFGSWVLWPETLEGLEFVKKMHKGNTPYVIVSKTGKPLDKDTKGGNENQTIKNHWDRLMDRIIADHPEFHRLPFKCLRKTGAQYIRNKVGTPELATMYLAHGEREDGGNDTLLKDYTSREWRKLYKALLKLRKLFAPVFATVAEPWKEKHHTISLATVDRIKLLRKQGKSYPEIAADVNLHHITVGKVCRQG